MIAAQYITLSELQRRVRQALEERFALPLWVSAEIAEVKVNYSGHCYLELVEKGEGDGVPKAQARAVIWRSQYARIASLSLRVSEYSSLYGSAMLKGHAIPMV